MSNSNNEHRELTAAELDLVAGGFVLENSLINNYASFSWSESRR